MSAFTEAVGRAAAAVDSVLSSNPPRAGEPYPIGEVLPHLIEQHTALQRAVDALDEPPGLLPVGTELAGLMSWLQLLRVLYLHLDEVPRARRVAVGRQLSSTHQHARRLSRACR